MKKTKYIFAALVLIAGSMTFTSCVQNDYYTPEPQTPTNNNNNNGPYVFDEEFNNDNRGWAFSSSADSAYASVANGQLEFINYSTMGANTQVVQTNMNTSNDFIIESRLRSDNEMGVIWGNSGNQYDYGYSFIINNGGYFIVYKEGNANTNVTVLKDWTANNAININNSWNKVVIEQTNGYWTFKVNGYEVHQMEARPLNGTYCGFIVLQQTEGYADYLTVEW